MTLEEVMMKADFPNLGWGSLSPDMKRSYTCHANAVRAFLGSEEVERVVAEAVSRARCNAGRPDAGKGLDEFIARAALSSIMEIPNG